MNTPPPITPLEFTDQDFDKAETLARALGYEQTAYTSTSALWGLFCLPENHAARLEKLCAVSAGVYRKSDFPDWSKKTPYIGGCIIKTAQFGLLFVQDCEDITGEVDL